MMVDFFAVALVGATGNLGKVLLPKLRNKYHVTVIMRKSSTADQPGGKNVTTVQVSDGYPMSERIPIFKQQDAVICTVSPRVLAVEYNIIHAAVNANVKHFIPAEFGLDTTDLAIAKVIPPILEKTAIIDELEKVSTQSEMTWTAVGTEIFLDWGLETGLFQLDMASNQATILGDGNTKFSTTTIDDVAQSVMKVLLQVEEGVKAVSNRFIFIQTFNTTQNELLDGLKQVTGQPWQTEHVNESEFLQKRAEKLEHGELEGLFGKVFVCGVLHSNFEEKPGYVDWFTSRDPAILDTQLQKVLAR